MTTVTISSYKIVQNYEHFKRFVLHSNRPQVEFIEGFEYEWGYNYTIQIKEIEISPRLTDGTSFRHQLVKVISKTPVSNDFKFQLFLDGRRYYQEESGDDEQMNASLQPIDTDTYLYMDELIIEVPIELKEVFLAIVEGKNKQKGTFIFVGTSRVKLVGLD